DFRAFYEKEIAFRKAMRYPPTVSLVNTVVRARTFTAAMDDAADVVQRVRAEAGASGDVRVLGPAPAPLARLRGEDCAQIRVKRASRRRAGEALQRALGARADIQRRVIVDVDPLSVL